MDEPPHESAPQNNHPEEARMADLSKDPVFQEEMAALLGTKVNQCIRPAKNGDCVSVVSPEQVEQWFKEAEKKAQDREREFLKQPN